MILPCESCVDSTCRQIKRLPPALFLRGENILAIVEDIVKTVIVTSFKWFFYFQGFFTSFGSILGNRVTDQLKTLSNQTETILKQLIRERSQIQMALGAITLLGDVLDCYNISDFFQPLPNEEALVKRATDQAPGKPLFLSSKCQFKYSKQAVYLIFKRCLQ